MNMDDPVIVFFLFFIAGVAGVAFSVWLRSRPKSEADKWMDENMSQEELRIMVKACVGKKITKAERLTYLKMTDRAPIEVRRKLLLVVPDEDDCK